MKASQHIKYSYQSHKKNPSFLRIAFIIISFFTLLALLAPVIASDGENSLIPFGPQHIDYTSPYDPPASKSAEDQNVHWLGTDALGRDLFAGIVHGSRTALIIGLGSALASLIFGLIFGMLFGFYGNSRLKLTRRQFVFFGLVSLLSIYLLIWTSNMTYGIHGIQILWPLLMLIVILVFYYWTIKSSLNSTQANDHKYALKLDNWSMRFLDLFKSLPALFILLVLLRLLNSSGILELIAIISFLFWSVSARHARAEMLKWRNKPFVYNAILQGQSDARIIFVDLLPFIVRPLIVRAAFLAAAALLLEATLSFLGIGIPVDHVSWGTMISDARNNTDAWWLILFPGLCLFLLIWSLQTIGRYVERRIKSEEQWQLN